MIDLTGKKIGCLRVVRRSSYKPKHFSKQAYWDCVCECGNSFPSPSQAIRRVRKCCIRCKGSLLRTDDSALNCFYASYRCDARRRNRVFTLTYEQFRILVTGDCCYCGSSPSPYKTSSVQSSDFNGIDRVDNSLPYVWENCKPCCRICNRAKRSLPEAEFRSWISQLCEFNRG